MRTLASGRAGNNFFRAMDCEQVGDPCAPSICILLPYRLPFTCLAVMRELLQGIYMHLKYHREGGQHQYLPPTHTHPSTHTYIHTYIHGFSLAFFAIPFLAIDLLIALRLAYMV